MKLLDRLLRPFRSQTIHIHYDEWGEIDKEQIDEVIKHMDKAFEAVDKVFLHTTPTKKPSNK